MSTNRELADAKLRLAAEMRKTAAQRRGEGAGDYQRATERLAKSYERQAEQLRKGGAR